MVHSIVARSLLRRVPQAVPGEGVRSSSLDRPLERAIINYGRKERFGVRSDAATEKVEGRVPRVDDKEARGKLQVAYREFESIEETSSHA